MAGEAARGDGVTGLPDLGEAPVWQASRWFNTAEPLAAFLHEYRVTHPVAVDVAVAGHPLPATMAAYDMQGTPTTVLIDRDGRIRLRALGGVDDLELGLQIGRLLGR